jgi:branched-subunit amino acid aminotransferase/4-amino-4-deoxychorismate lyase
MENKKIDSPYVFFNGEFIPADEVRVAFDDAGFLHGDSVFEIMRAYSGKVFLAEWHIRRIIENAAEIGIRVPAGVQSLAKAVQKLLDLNNLLSARVRLTVSRGPGHRGLGQPGTKPTIVITAFNYSPLSESRCLDGYKLVYSPYRKDENSPLANISSGNHLVNMLSYRAAQAVPADDAVILNNRGELVEGSRSNIFFASNGVLYTPAEESGAIPGVTREMVIHIARSRNIPMTIGRYKPEQLEAADEAFITGSLLEIIPVRSINQKNMPNCPGPVTAEIRQQYLNLI